MNNKVTKDLVAHVLRNPSSVEWSTQGLGMLRTYLSRETRLHIWDQSLVIPNVSPIHDHPWDLESHIVAGVLHQQRFQKVETAFGAPFKMATIKCGKDAHTLEEPKQVYLVPGFVETYKEGQTYTQFNSEIHKSSPENGTVTLVHRTFKPNTEIARVFWMTGDFVSAEPSVADKTTIERVTQYALETWFK